MCSMVCCPSLYCCFNCSQRACRRACSCWKSLITLLYPSSRSFFMICICFWCVSISFAWFWLKSMFSPETRSLLLLSPKDAERRGSFTYDTIDRSPFDTSSSLLRRPERRCSIEWWSTNWTSAFRIHWSAVAGVASTLVDVASDHVRSDGCIPVQDCSWSFRSPASNANQRGSERDARLPNVARIGCSPSRSARAFPGTPRLSPEKIFALRRRAMSRSNLPEFPSLWFVSIRESPVAVREWWCPTVLWSLADSSRIGPDGLSLDRTPSLCCSTFLGSSADPSYSCRAVGWSVGGSFLTSIDTLRTG